MGFGSLHTLVTVLDSVLRKHPLTHVRRAVFIAPQVTPTSARTRQWERAVASKSCDCTRCHPEAPERVWVAHSGSCGYAHTCGGADTDRCGLKHTQAHLAPVWRRSRQALWQQRWRTYGACGVSHKSAVCVTPVPHW